MPRAIPPNDIIFKVISIPYIILNVAMTDTGMEREIIAVAQKLRRKKRTIYDLSQQRRRSWVRGRKGKGMKT